MASKRMIAKIVVRSDAFLNLPFSTQALYTQLAIEADDYGMLGNGNTIKRMIGASDNDLQALIDKNYLISFNDNNEVVAITHWNVNNAISPSKRKETLYPNEYSQLTLCDNGEYTLNSAPLQTKCRKFATEKLPKSSKKAKQNSIGKNSIDKNSIYSQTVSAFNSICTSLSSVKTISETRKKHINSFIDTLKKYDLTVENYFKKVQASDFLTGRSKAWCNCSFDWLIKQSNTIKVCEGNYDNKANSNDDYIY